REKAEPKPRDAKPERREPEAKPRPEPAAKVQREPDRQPQDVDAGDEGWNGPVPSFLSFGLGS
ncbi:MAG TPA: hypothetical protein VEY69_03705, partial [Lautropia sp.]|nr:hypothetical protein [Lautropia sp.]